MKRVFSLTLVIAFAIASGGLLVACGDEGAECGAGTVEQGGTCVPACADGQYWDGTACTAIQECGDGTTFNTTTGKCEPDSSVCEDGTTWNPDTLSCDPDIAECGPGTTLNENTGRCEPACGDDEYWDGTACAPVPVCADGTTFNTDTGECEPDITDCAPGTHLENGECLPDVECGPGTHPEGGQCVADYLPDPDVDDNEQVLPEFTIPDVGEENAISLGGTIGEPVDLDDDGDADPDFDQFMFQTQAGGIYLKLWATSEGSALPAFAITGIETASFGPDPADWEVFYTRYGIEPNQMDVNREVYLPKAGVYIIEVTDYNHLVNSLFGYSFIPVGGDDFTYYMTIEQLPTPVPTALDLSSPATETGDMTSGALSFFSADLLTGDIVDTISAGLPLVDTPSDLFPALMIFAPDGAFLAESLAFNPVADAQALFRAGADGEFLVVQDIHLVIGPNRDFRLDTEMKVVTDMTGQVPPTDIDLLEGETQLLSWDLLASDFAVFAMFPVTTAEVIQTTLYDANMQVMGEGSSTYSDPDMYPAMTFYYAEMDTTVYVSVREATGLAVTYTADTAVTATPALAIGSSSNVPVTAMPQWTFYDAAIGHFSGTAGDFAFFTDFVTNDPTKNWVSPITLFLTPTQATMGPAMDLATEARIEPWFVRVPDDGEYLMWVFDPDGDIVGGSFDITMNTLTPVDLGAADVGSDAGASGEGLDATTGVAVFSYTAGASQLAEITVTPAGGTTIRPEVWAMSLGEWVCPWWCEWIADPALLQLGVMGMGTAAADGEAATASVSAPYDGPMFVFVRDAGGNAGASDTFDINVSVIPPPDNDTCDTALAVDISSGSATVVVDTSGATNAVDLTIDDCTGYSTSGKDLFYSLDLTAGQSITITQTPSGGMDSAIYLFTDCADPGGSCVAGDDSTFGGEPETITYAVAADGTYIFAADSYSGEGQVTLEFVVN